METVSCLGSKQKIRQRVAWRELRTLMTTIPEVWITPRKSISSARHKFAADDQPDQRRAKSAVGRRMQYARDVYIDWADNMESIAICFGLMITTREATV